ncbi:MAG: hypothetical protein M3P89_14360 [Actinomycetota bacterium]|nr:hypothetical protein [Actinomycetota bacterium]
MLIIVCTPPRHADRGTSSRTQPMINSASGRGCGLVGLGTRQPARARQPEVVVTAHRVAEEPAGRAAAPAL